MNRALFSTWVARLGSMTFAVVVLIVLALASTIGTVLLQNEEQTDYLDAFGPLWYWVLRWLGMFDMYHAWWFLGLLVFLTVSLSACLWRNVPKMLKEMRVQKAWLGERHWRHLPVRFELRAKDPARLEAWFRARLAGWRFSEAEAEGVRFVRADAGWFHKWGYILAHGGILVILLGGWMSIEFGFRGTMNVVEGGTNDTIQFLRGTEVVEKKLPFTVRCNDFSIAFYPTGQPKEFRSNLTILDHGKEVLTRDIIVNEPLEYRGIRIYQASFGDGGSPLVLRLFPLRGDGKVRRIRSRVYETWRDPEGRMSIEFRNLRPFNVENMADPGEPKRFRDLGPAVEFVLRAPGARPVLVKGFMNPFVDEKGKDRGSFLMISTSGDAKDYRPVFLGLDFTNDDDWKLYRAFVRALAQVRDDPAVPAKRKSFVAFKRALDEVFGDARPEDLPEIAERVLAATQVLPRLPWPALPVLADFEQRYYTGLEVARDPGMNVVWAGSAVLVIGLVVMLYFPHRRLWLRLGPDGRAALGGSTNRGELDFARFAEQLVHELEAQGLARISNTGKGGRR